MTITDRILALGGTGVSPGPMLRAILNGRPAGERAALLDVLELARSELSIGPPPLPAWAERPFDDAAGAAGLSVEVLRAVSWELTGYRPDYSREAADLSGHGILSVPYLVLEADQLRPAHVVASRRDLEDGDDAARLILARCAHAGAAAIGSARRKVGLRTAIERYVEAAGHPDVRGTGPRIAAAIVALAIERIPRGPLDAIAADLEGDDGT